MNDKITLEKQLKQQQQKLLKNVKIRGIISGESVGRLLLNNGAFFIAQIPGALNNEAMKNLIEQLSQDEKAVFNSYNILFRNIMELENDKEFYRLQVMYCRERHNNIMNRFYATETAERLIVERKGFINYPADKEIIDNLCSLVHLPTVFEATEEIDETARILFNALRYLELYNLVIDYVAETFKAVEFKNLKQDNTEETFKVIDNLKAALKERIFADDNIKPSKEAGLKHCWRSFDGVTPEHFKPTAKIIDNLKKELRTVNLDKTFDSQILEFRYLQLRNSIHRTLTIWNSINAASRKGF